MAYIRKRAATPVNDDGFDFDQARIEWQILSLWDELPDCFKSRQVIDKVLQSEILTDKDEKCEPLVQLLPENERQIRPI